MSIQTTNYLLREEADEMAISVLLNGKYLKRARHDVIDMSDEEIEDLIETTFDNYSIK